MDERTLCFLLLSYPGDLTTHHTMHFLGYTHTKVTKSILIDIHIIAFSEPLTTTYSPSPRTRVFQYLTQNIMLITINHDFSGVPYSRPPFVKHRIASS